MGSENTLTCSQESVTFEVLCYKIQIASVLPVMKISPRLKATPYRHLRLLILKNASFLQTISSIRDMRTIHAMLRIDPPVHEIEFYKTNVLTHLS
jgi:hypothetical protein